jgi:ribonuclease P protein component
VKRRFRLRSSTDFERVRRSGKSYTHPLVVLVAARHGEQPVRVGVAAGRSVGNAVLRNRAKRVLRACLDEHLAQLQPGWDLVFLARRGLPAAPYAVVQLAVRQLLMRAKILVQSNEYERSRLLE